MGVERTRLVVTRAGHRLRVETSSGALTPRVLATTATSTRVTLVATTALLLGGDEVELDIAVGPDAALDLSDLSAMVAYHGRGRGSRLTTRIELHERAQLVWRAEPFVVSDGADTCRDLNIDAASSARALIRDTVILGRTGEAGGDVVARTRIAVDGRPVLVEDFDLRAGGSRSLPGVLRGERVVDQLTRIADDAQHIPAPPPTPHGLTVLTPVGPARMWRWAGSAMHESPLPHVLSKLLDVGSRWGR